MVYIRPKHTAREIEHDMDATAGRLKDAGFMQPAKPAKKPPAKTAATPKSPAAPKTVKVEKKKARPRSSEEATKKRKAAQAAAEEERRAAAEEASALEQTRKEQEALHDPNASFALRLKVALGAGFEIAAVRGPGKSPRRVILVRPEDKKDRVVLMLPKGKGQYAEATSELRLRLAQSI